MKLTELSNDTSRAYRAKASAEAITKSQQPGIDNEIKSCKRAKGVARAVRLEVRRRKMFESTVSSLSLDAAKKKLAQLKADKAELFGDNNKLSSDKDAGALDEINYEIKDLEAHIATIAVKESASSAASAYSARLNECHKLLTQIKQGLEQHAIEQSRKPESWGFAGDLAHIAQQLQEIWEFMSHDENKMESAQILESNPFSNENSEFSPQFIQSVARGEVDLYDVLSRNTPEGRALNRMVDVIAAETRLHPDDDIEQILDIIEDKLFNRM